MTQLTTPLSAAAWRPDHYTFAPGDVLPDALILQHATIAGEIDGDAPALRVAFINDDDAVFKAEGADLDEAEPELGEVLVHTAKLTQLVRLSNEQFNQPNTAQQVSESAARALTRAADQAFLAQAAPVSPAVAPPAGLVNVDGIAEASDPVAGDLDVLVDLVAELQANLADPSAIIVDPVGWAALRKIKAGADLNASLLGAGTTDAAPMLLGVPVVVSPHAARGTGLVVDSSAVAAAVGDVKVTTSEHRYFESDGVALRATWRLGWNLVRPERVGLFTVDLGND